MFDLSYILQQRYYLRWFSCIAFCDFVNNNIQHIGLCRGMDRAQTVSLDDNLGGFLYLGNLT